MSVKRGTTNGNARGPAHARKVRRAWIMKTFASDVPGLCRCYRCGCLLYDPSIPFQYDPDGPLEDRLELRSLTIDRIVPGYLGGTYRRSNIRPACEPCNITAGGTENTTAINIVFAVVEGTPNLTFVEVENDRGASVGVGEWQPYEDDGIHKLRIDNGYPLNLSTTKQPKKEGK